MRPMLPSLMLGGGLAPPVVRNSNLTSYSFQTNWVIPFPSAATVGDACLVFTKDQYGITAIPAGWNRISVRNGANVNGAGFWKNLDASDIATGSVTVTMAASSTGHACAVVFRGPVGGIRAEVARRNNSGGEFVTLALPTLYAGDKLVMFGGLINAGNPSWNLGTTLQSNAYVAMNHLDIAADGTQSPVFTYNPGVLANYHDTEVVVAVAPVGATIGGYRYLQFYLTASTGGTGGAAIMEWEIRENAASISVANDYLSVSDNGNQFGWLPARAVNADLSDGWFSASTASVPATLTLDFGTVKRRPAEIKIFPRSGWESSQAPKDFQIRGSNDGTNWTTLLTQSNLTTGWVGGTGRTFTI